MSAWSSWPSPSYPLRFTLVALGVFGVLAGDWSPTSQTSAQTAGDVLRTLKPKHPRLYVLNDELPAIKQAIENDLQVRKWHEQLQAQAKKMLDEPTAEHKLKGPRLLDQSKAALRRISTLAGLYRLDGDPKKAARARQEMLAVAAFPDWNPSHFLDVAEMTNAMAIGYDWLFDTLSAQDRAIIRKAIVDKGLKEGQIAYTQDKGKGAWWTKTNNNWGQVCHGGLTVGALAIADEEPALCRDIISRARTNVPLAMQAFAPDGGCPEGPGYWSYATEYNVYHLAALQSALGTDLGLKKLPGLGEAGLFRIHTIGPLKKTFNYADAHEGISSSPQMLWLAREFNRPLLAAHEQQIFADRPAIFHLLWSGKPIAGKDKELPRDTVFRGVQVACFRSAWDDPQGFYIGFKGGDNKAGHAHLDLGSFVLDALGERWALDLPPDDYNLPGYFDIKKQQRWTYYRLRTEGHNTLTLDGENQVPTAAAPLVAYYSTEARAFAVANLTEAYGPQVTSAFRGLALLNRRQVLVQDELQCTKQGQIAWNFHTRAKIELKADRALLSQGKAQLEVRVLSPKNAKFEIVSANPPPPQAQQPDVQNLVLRVPSATQVRIAVLLAPVGSEPVPSVEPLSKWIALGKQKK